MLLSSGLLEQERKACYKMRQAKTQATKSGAFIVNSHFRQASSSASVSLLLRRCLVSAYALDDPFLFRNKKAQKIKKCLKQCMN